MSIYNHIFWFSLSHYVCLPFAEPGLPASSSCALWNQFSPPKSFLLCRGNNINTAIFYEEKTRTLVVVVEFCVGVFSFKAVRKKLLARVRFNQVQILISFDQFIVNVIGMIYLLPLRWHGLCWSLHCHHYDIKSFQYTDLFFRLHNDKLALGTNRVYSPTVLYALMCGLFGPFTLRFSSGSDLKHTVCLIKGLASREPLTSYTRHPQVHWHGWQSWGTFWTQQVFVLVQRGDNIFI